MTAAAAMTAVKKVHAEAHQWQEPNEPVADEDVCPMLGDEQESCHGKKADESQPDCGPPKRLWSGMFVVFHELSNSAIAEAKGQLDVVQPSVDTVPPG